MRNLQTGCALPKERLARFAGLPTLQGTRDRDDVRRHLRAERAQESAATGPRRRRLPRRRTGGARRRSRRAGANRSRLRDGDARRPKAGGVPHRPLRSPLPSEPIHGSAPELAGRGICNPVGTLLSAAMRLRESLALGAEASAVEQAVEAALDAGVRTRELGGSASTREMTDAIIVRLGKPDAATSRRDLTPRPHAATSRGNLTPQPHAPLTPQPHAATSRGSLPPQPHAATSRGWRPPACADIVVFALERESARVHRLARP